MPRYRTAEGECTNIFQPIAHIHHNAQHLWLKMGERKWKCTLKKSIFPFWAATMEIPESGLRLVSHCTVGLRPSANDLATLPYFGDIGHNIVCKCILCLCIMGNILCLCILYNILVRPRPCHSSLLQRHWAQHLGDLLCALSVLVLTHGSCILWKLCTEICAVFCVYVQCARLAEQTVKKGLVAVPVPCTYHRQTNRFTI